MAIDERSAPAVFEQGRGAARQLGRPILVSVARRVPARDPLAFFVAGARIADDRFIWLRPSEGFALAGVGAAWTATGTGAGRFADVAAAWRALCDDAVVDAPAGVAGIGPIAMGGFAFDPLRPKTDRWQGYPDARLVLPRALLTAFGGETWLTVNTLVGPDDAVPGDRQPATGLDGLLDGCGDRLAAFADPFDGFQANVDGLDSYRQAPSADQLADGASGSASDVVIEDVLPPTVWQANVADVAQAIRRGELEKVVLARACRIAGRRAFDAPRALAQLRASYPDCFVFAVARGDRCFLGATPERLVRLRGGEVRATCLAGSIGRGATAAEDRRLGEMLLASEKDRAEHAIVVRFLRAAIAELGAVVEPVGEPTLLKMQHVQHLYTPIVGRVAGDRTVLDLVERLHPTPAVGGSPRDAALRLIRAREQLDRGWYAGPIGWLDARGEGEFAVAIRSALLHGAEALLFAGCGIVAGSDPASEYAESCLKLRPMLAALTSTV